MKRLQAIVLVGLAICASCRKSDLPDVSSKQYADLCSDFYLGLAGLQAGEDVRAKEYLTKSTQVAPGEPAGWADLGILQLRQQQFDAAFQSIGKARDLAPSDSRIEALLGLVESRRGNLPQAAEHLKRAVSLDAHNLKALYSLAEQTEREASPESLAAAQELLKQILQERPANEAVLLEDVRVAAKRGDAAEVRNAIAKLNPLSTHWPDAARQQFGSITQIASGGNVRAAAVQVQFLRNILLREPSYRQSLDEINTPATLVAQPFTHFLRLPSPNSQAAASDSATRFTAHPVPGTANAKVAVVTSLFLSDQGGPTVAWADDKALHLATGTILPLPGPVTRNGIAGADLNYDFKTDLAIASTAGLRIYRQEDPQHFTDITASSKIPPSIASGSYTGVWAFDIDLDGDLDLVFGVPHGDPVVLRNNGDGSFTAIQPVHGMNGLTQFAAADLDGDGDPDLALVDASGSLHVFLNQRLGTYAPRAIPATLSSGIVSIAAGDVNGDGILDIVALKNDGSVLRLSRKQESTDWQTEKLLQAKVAVPATVLLADVDNNGALDVIANNQVFLNDGKSFSALAEALPANPQGIVDLDGDGRLDVLGIDASARAIALTNKGAKNYQWQVIRTRAAHATGDQRINSYGIGGEIEIRSDLLAQKQVITAPVLHFGLGEHNSIQFARIVWPNGFVQAEFDLKANQTVLAEQRIKGSCPMLFAWDGRGMAFLKDVGPWGSALGLNVNAQGKGIYGTREWFNIRGSELPPHDGYYDLRITAEYWETYYMDHYSLLAVDHPSGTEVYTDERFALPPPEPNMVLTETSKPFAKATDDHGMDVTDLVSKQDRRYLDTFGRGQYQGLTHEHWVELELPSDAPTNGPLYLVGQSWIHDTDATIVKAQAQNSTAHPHGLSIEVPDASGHWTTVRDGLGFPKGRIKTIILDISSIFKPDAPRKLRLRTNLELYWDKLAWARGASQDKVRTQQIGLSAADLRFRGFSLITQANPSSPELPHYDQIQESDLRWHNQEGYATRYGDVRELLQNVDDRYVITSPGDELRMKFPALAAPQAGWQRDFILICDGWVKDGDYNSTFAGTIQPLPYHAMQDYITPPTALENDPAYKLHPNDWRMYQTRYVSPDHFISALWNQ